jgi:putative oxidoreductase
VAPSSYAWSDDAGKLIARVSLGVILAFHGVYKITHGVAWIGPRLTQIGLPAPLAYGTYVAEVLAPVFLIFGYQVRLAALAVAVDMVMAIVLVLRPQVFSLSAAAGGGWSIEFQALLLLLALAISCLGAGRYSVETR